MGACTFWHLGYTEEASAGGFPPGRIEGSSVRHPEQEPSYRVKGVLTDCFDSTIKSMRTLFPGARLGNCLRHADPTKLPEETGGVLHL